MNAWMYLTFIVVFNVLLGGLTAFEVNNSANAQNYLSEKVAQQMQIVDNYDNSKTDIGQMKDDQMPDKTTGNINTMSFNLWTVLSYSFASWAIIDPQNTFEYVLVYTTTFLNAIIALASALLLWTLLKAKSVPQ